MSTHRAYVICRYCRHVACFIRPLPRLRLHYDEAITPSPGLRRRHATRFAADATMHMKT